MHFLAVSGNPCVAEKGIKGTGDDKKGVMSGTEGMEELVSLIDCFADIPVGAVQRILHCTWYRLSQLRVATDTMKVWPLVVVKQEKWRLNWVEIRDLRLQAIKTASAMMIEILLRVEEQAVLTRTLYMPESMRHAILSAPTPDVPMAIRMRINRSIFPIPMLQPPLSHTAVALKEWGDFSMSKQEMHKEIGEVLLSLLDIPIKALSVIANVSHHTIGRIRVEHGLGDHWPYESIRDKRYSISAEEVARLRTETLATLQPMSFKSRLLHAAAEWVTTRTTVTALLRGPYAASLLPSQELQDDLEIQKTEEVEEIQEIQKVEEVEEAQDGGLEWFGLLGESSQPGGEGGDNYWTNAQDKLSSTQEEEYWAEIGEMMQE